MRHEVHLQGGARLITDIEVREGKMFTSTFVLDGHGTKGRIFCTCTCGDGTSSSNMCDDDSVVSCDCGGTGDLVCGPLRA